MIKCLIIDEKELARELLKTYVDKTDFLELKGMFENPLVTTPFLKNKTIDIVLLDIQMPELKGTDFAKLLPGTTRFIFTKAYSDYA